MARGRVRVRVRVSVWAGVGVRVRAVAALLPAARVRGAVGRARRGRALQHVLEHLERLEALREEEHLLVGVDRLSQQLEREQHLVIARLKSRRRSQ